MKSASIITLLLLIFVNTVFAAETFTIDMTVGVRDPQVRLLQEFLNRDSATTLATIGAGAPGYETDYYGSRTADAVRRFQVIYRVEILDPLGLTFPTGYVGGATRYVLNRLYDEGGEATSTAYVINNIVNLYSGAGTSTATSTATSTVATTTPATATTTATTTSGLGESIADRAFGASATQASDPYSGSGPRILPQSGAFIPRSGQSWQWQLQGAIDTSFDVDVYDIDLFNTSQGTIDTLHGKGKKVICYFSAGTYEPGRPDSGQFPKEALGSPVEGWPGEKWLDVRNQTVRKIMSARMDIAKSKKCDGVEPDNVDGYTNNPGFNYGAAGQLDFNKFIANTAHSKGLTVGLKNDTDQVGQLVQYFDFAVNEQCYEYSECGVYSPFTQRNKAVFNAEYSGKCPSSKQNGLSTILKDEELLARPWEKC